MSNARIFISAIQTDSILVTEGHSGLRPVQELTAAQHQIEQDGELVRMVTIL